MGGRRNASHGKLLEVPSVYYILGGWEKLRHPLALWRLHVPHGAPGVGYLYALVFELHPDGTMRTRVCQTGAAVYAEVKSKKKCFSNALGYTLGVLEML